MKRFYIFYSLLIMTFPLKASTSLYQSFIDREEPQKTLGEGKLVSKTRDALLSFDYIEQRADYLVFKIKNLTFGEYSDNILFIAPLVTGNVQFSMYDINFYYDHLDNKSGFKYKIKF